MASKDNKKPARASKPGVNAHQDEAKAPAEPTNRKMGIPVVISFIDITARKEAEQQLVLAKQTLEERLIERTRELDEVNEKLLQTSNLFYALFNTNPLPTALTTLEDAIFMDLNEAYLEYFDLKRIDLIGHSAHEFHLPLDPKIRPQLMARLKAERSIRDLEMRINHPSTGEERIILVSLQFLQVNNRDALIQTFIDITRRVTAEKQIRTLATELTEAEQEERRRLSQILHDDLQQRLFAIKMQVTMLQDAIQNAGVHSEQVDFSQLNEWLNESITMTRNLSTDLSPAILRGEGLTDALLWLAAQMRDQYALNVAIEPNNVDTRFEDSLRILLFQCVREALFNIVKHANTGEAVIMLEDVNEHVRLTVKDQGDGFNTDGLASKTTRLGGLLNLRHRLNLMGCRLQITSQPGDGTEVIIDIFAKEESPS